MCEAGYSGSDCGGEAPMYLEVTHIGPAELQDALGMYRLDAMYLYVLDHPAQDLAIQQSSIPSQVKWLHYDHGSKGWAMSKFNSSCIDDICFFAYNQDVKPPSFGYVYGGPELHVFHSQILFDQATHKVSSKLGFDYLFAFTPDPNVPSFGLEEFNGRYLLQPRYTHVNTKYAIFPVSIDAPNKRWVLSGLLGDPRKRRIIVQAQDPSENRYVPPAGPWEPAELNFQLRPACMNHVGDLACMHLADVCPLQDTDGDWVRKCCRQTCGSCSESRLSCPLAGANNVLAL
jgi:hypothetical protein